MLLASVTLHNFLRLGFIALAGISRLDVRLSLTGISRVPTCIRILCKVWQLAGLFRYHDIRDL